MALTNPPSIPTQQAWQPLTLLNGWQNWNTLHPADGLNPAGYWKDSLGVVHLRGTICNGTMNSLICTLPTGYRPPNREVMICSAGQIDGMTAGSSFGRIDVLANGQITQFAGGTSYLSLDGITFRVS